MSHLRIKNEVRELGTGWKSFWLGELVGAGDPFSAESDGWARTFQNEESGR
jgi:hypothetical protein